MRSDSRVKQPRSYLQGYTWQGLVGLSAGWVFVAALGFVLPLVWDGGNLWWMLPVLAVALAVVQGWRARRLYLYERQRSREKAARGPLPIVASEVRS